MNPASVNGGDSSQATVTLTGPAPKGGLVVTLSSSDPAAQVPASVTVPAGSTSATFTVTTSAVTQQVVATITATANGTSRDGDLTVLAPTLERLVLDPADAARRPDSHGHADPDLPGPRRRRGRDAEQRQPGRRRPGHRDHPRAAGRPRPSPSPPCPCPKTVIATITATFAGLSQMARLEVRSARITSVSVAPTSLTGGAPPSGR